MFDQIRTQTISCKIKKAKKAYGSANMLQSEIILTCFSMTVLLVLLNFPEQLNTNGEFIHQKGVRRLLLDAQGN